MNMYRNRLLYVLFVVLFLCVLVGKYKDGIVIYMNTLSIAITALIYMLTFRNKANIYFIIPSLCIFLFYVLQSWRFGSDSFGHILINFVVIFSCPSIAYFLIKDEVLAKRIFNTYLLLLSLILTFVFILSIIKNIYFGVYLNDFFELTSRNYIIYLLLLLTILVSVCDLRETNRVVFFKLVPILLYTPLSLGRASMAVAAAYLLILCFFYYRKMFLWIASLTTVFALIFSNYIILVVSRYSNFSTRGLDSPRWQMIREFIEKVELNNLFIGLDFSNMPTILEYGGSPHNNYLDLLAKYGAAGLIFSFVLLALPMLSINTKSKIRLFVLMSFYIIMVRLFTDSYHFVSFLDFAIVFLFLSTFLKTKKKDNKTSGYIVQARL